VLSAAAAANTSTTNTSTNNNANTTNTNTTNTTATNTNTTATTTTNLAWVNYEGDVAVHDRRKLAEGTDDDILSVEPVDCCRRRR